MLNLNHIGALAALLLLSPVAIIPASVVWPVLDAIACQRPDFGPIFTGLKLSAAAVIPGMILAAIDGARDPHNGLG
jgi:hypothetical protein